MTMQRHRMKFVCAGMSAILALGAGDAAFAHVLNGALGRKAEATDIFSIVCPQGNDSVRLEVQVNDVKPVKPPRLQVTVEKAGKTDSAVDPKDGDGRYSPFAVVSGGTGAYKVSISKLVSKPGRPDRTRAQAERYVLQFHCMMGNEHPDTEVFYDQNQ